MLRGLLVPVVLLAWSSWSYAAENQHLDNITRILAASSLSQKDQAEIRSKAISAIKAGVPAEDVEIIVQRSVNHSVEAMTLGRFLDTSAAVKKDGLPVDTVLDRIEQGLAKRVPSDRVATASEHLAKKLAEARPLIDGVIKAGVTARKKGEREAAIGSTARALEKSISPEAVRGIGTAVQAKGGSLPLFTRAMDTATYFTGSGVSAKTASDLVQLAVGKGYSEGDLDGMVRQMDSNMRNGMKVTDAASQMMNNTMQGQRGMDMRQGTMDHRVGGPGMGGMGGRH